jgi:hypothetical protein
MDQTVTFGKSPAPAWSAVCELLQQFGFPVQIRMIDGELAFPDEEPPDTWRELRVGASGGMVTLRRSADAVTFVTWGNADGELRQTWNALVWAFAEAAAGAVQTPQGVMTAAQFRGQADLPPAIREK